MSVLFMDGFDHYGSGSQALNNMLAGPWASFAGTQDPTIDVPSWGPARTGPYCLSGAIYNTGWNRRILPSTTTRIFASFGFAVTSIPTNNNDPNAIFAILDGSNNVINYLRINTVGGLEVCQSNGTVITATNGPVITAQTWHFIEMDINTAGNWTVKIDDSTGQDAPILTAALGGGTIAAIGVLNFRTAAAASPPAPNNYMDDLIIRDATGGINDDWMGDRRVATLFADADTTTAGWSPSYYRTISPGIGRFSYMRAGSSTVQNSQARITMAAATALDIGASDFTLETFVRLDKLPETTEYFTLFSRWNENSTTGRSFRLVFGGPSYNGGMLEFQTSTDGSGSTVVSKLLYPWTPNANQWYHVALCRDNGDLLLFIDGKQVGLPIPDTDTYFGGSSSVFVLGGYVASTSVNTAAVAGTTLVGRMDETRFTNGVSRYNSDFSPPTDMFPRGAVDDPDWSNVVLLVGYDSGINDESSFGRTLTSAGGVTSQLPIDGSTIGVWSTVGTNKADPDDNTFIYASLTNATNIFTMTTLPTDGDTVTVGTTDGVTPAVYKFVSSLSDPFDVLIGTDADETLDNLVAAINADAGAGTIYGTGTTSNADVSAVPLVAGQIQVIALVAGSSGNSIACSSSSPGVWDDTNLYGGEDIPGPSVFKFERPPSNTTIISAVQLNVRARKTDAGTGTIQTGLVGPLGGITKGSTHALSISPIYYADIIEVDPDTSGPISPTTIINGGFFIDRTA
jgi:hypothetical protein